MVFKTCAAIVTTALLVACGVPKFRGRSVDSSPAAAGAQVRSPAAGGSYRVDTAQSELRLLVYRAGPMARFGHNHVIVNRALTGWVDAAGTGSAAAFAVRLPAADFAVDDRAARMEEGPDFTDDVAEDAKTATRRNMLSAALLDGEHFPAITITSVSVVPTAARRVATVTVDVAGHDSTSVFPFDVEFGAGRLSATGTVTLRQSALGLVPFSVLFGALQVQDEFVVKFKLVAQQIQ